MSTSQFIKDTEMWVKIKVTDDNLANDCRMCEYSDGSEVMFTEAELAGFKAQGTLKLGEQLDLPNS